MLPAELFSIIEQEAKKKQFKILVFFNTVRATILFAELANTGTHKRHIDYYFFLHVH